MTRRKFYLLISSACLSGYIWLLYSLARGTENYGSSTLCLVKNVTGISCPSCGSTRSLLSLIHLNLGQALAYNPIGILLGIALLVSPLLILSDLLFYRETSRNLLKSFDQLLRRRTILGPFILIILINWIWTISKGL